MKILALEFSSDLRSAAILDSSQAGAASSPAGLSVAEMSDHGPRNIPAFDLIAAVLRDARLEPAQIECICAGLGPGSYTGIRVAISIAQGWQLARGVHLLGLSSVECLAAQAQAEGLFGRVHLAIDAQRNEFYLAAYDIAPETIQEIGPLHLASFEEANAIIQAGQLLAGPGIARWFPSARVLYPRAANLARLASRRNDFISGDKLEPIYLRPTAFVKAPPPRQIV